MPIIRNEQQYQYQYSIDREQPENVNRKEKEMFAHRNSQSSLHAAQALMNTQSGIEVTQNTMKHCENIKAKKKREFETKTDEYSAMWRNFGCEEVSIRKSMVLLYAHRRYG